jgi:hypothetical protein
MPSWDGESADFEITSLEGGEAATALEELRITDAAEDLDLGPPTKLPALRSLEMLAGFRDLTALRECKRLQRCALASPSSWSEADLVVLKNYSDKLAVAHSEGNTLSVVDVAEAKVLREIELVAAQVDRIDAALDQPLIGVFTKARDRYEIWNYEGGELVSHFASSQHGNGAPSSPRG